MKLTRFLSGLLTRLTIYFTTITLVALTCTGIEKNKEKITHVNHMNGLFKKTSNHPYPDQNFLYMMQNLNVKVEDEEVQQLISTASGIAVKNTGETVYGLTAGHWCDATDDILENEEFKNTFPGPSSIVLQTSFYGETYDIEVIHSDSLYDICVIKFESPYANNVKRIKPAKKYPKLGEKLYTVSSPLGMFHPYTRFHFEGYFSGCMPSGVYCFYTIPGVEGSSGSGVLNRKGDLVSILDISVIDFHNITGGARLEAIHEIFIIYIP